MIAKFGPRCFLCKLKSLFKSDCLQFWFAVAEVKHPRLKGQQGTPDERGRSTHEREEKPQVLATKKMQTVLEETSGTENETAVNVLRIDFKAATRNAPNRCN